MSLGGAAGGALTGAQLGSAIPGVGTVLGGIAGGLLGGFGSKKKKAPSPADIAGQQLEFSGALLPGLLQQQQQFAPQFAGLDLALTQQFAPQFAQTQRDILTQANPVQSQALQQLGQVLNAQDINSVALDPALQQALQQNVRASQAARGVARSPISSLTEALRTVELGAQERNRRQQLALTLGGSLPVVQGQTLQAANFLPNISGLQSQANNLAFSRFASDQAQRGIGLNILGTALGGLGQQGGGFLNTLGGSSGAPFLGTSTGNTLGQTSNRLRGIFGQPQIAGPGF